MVGYSDHTATVWWSAVDAELVQRNADEERWLSAATSLSDNDRYMIEAADYIVDMAIKFLYNAD